MFDLLASTPPAWLDVVFADFDSFLIDHTLCERKASAAGMSLIAKYPNRIEILDELVAFSREELEHFHIMLKILLSRGLTLVDDQKDAYVNGLRAVASRGSEDEVFLDRLVIPSIIEARSCERLLMVHEALEPGDLKDTYQELCRAEARHRGLFLRLARNYFPQEQIQNRVEHFLVAEAKLVASLPFRAAVH